MIKSKTARFDENTKGLVTKFRKNKIVGPMFKIIFELI